MENNVKTVLVVSLLVILILGFSVIFSVHQLKETDYDKCLDKCGWIKTAREQTKGMELEVECIYSCADLVMEDKNE